MVYEPGESVAAPPNKQEMLKSELLERIRSGAYTEKLPGMQALADEFAVNVKTVNKAVRALVAEGVIENRGPRGTWVSRRPAVPLRIPPPWSEVEERMYARATELFSSGTGLKVAVEDEADVVKVNAASISTVAGRLRPLDDLAGREFLSRLMAEAVELFSYGGTQYGLPLTVSPYLLYYSVEHLAKLGLSRPGPFGSADEFVDLCRRLVEEAGARYGFSAFERFTYVLPFFWQSGVEILAPDELSGRLHEPEVRRIFELYAELHRYSLPDAGEQSYAPALEALLAGELAMTGWGGWMESWLAGEPRGRFGVGPLEIAGRRDTLLFSEGFAIAADSAVPERAWRFLEALFSPEAQQPFIASGVQIPAFLEGARPVPRMIVEMLAEAHPGGRRLPPEVIDLFTAEWKGFLAGDESYDDFAARVSPALAVLLAHLAREREWADRTIGAAPDGPDPRHGGGPAASGGR